MSDDRLMRFMALLAILLFLSALVLPISRGRYAWAKWARWGAIAVFSLAVLYAVAMTIRWLLGIR